MITIDPVLFQFATSFLFAFAVTFGLLSIANKSKDEQKPLFEKNINVIISIVIGIVSASYAPFVSFIQDVLPVASILMVIIFFIVLLQRIFSQQVKAEDAATIAISLAIALLLVGLMWDKMSKFFPTITGAQDILWVVGILIIVLIFYAANKIQ